MEPKVENKAQKVLCEATLFVDGNGQIHQTSACGKIALCILCRSCSQHCYGHNQLRTGLKDRQFEYVQSNGQSEG
jgi:hypothetical protein